MRYDCVAGYHLNYLTCGIAKFNLLLGRKMGAPFFNLYDPRLEQFSAPLLSVKLSEYTPEDLASLPNWIDKRVSARGYSVFLHGYESTPLEDHLIRCATAVYCGNRAMYERLLPLNPNTHSLWCPGTNMSHQSFEKTDLTVFSFGMAHKLKTESTTVSRTCSRRLVGRTQFCCRPRCTRARASMSPSSRFSRK